MHVRQVHIIPQLFTMIVSHIFYSLQFYDGVTIGNQIHAVMLI